MSVVPWRLGRHLVMLGALVALLALSVVSLAQSATADAPAVDPKELEQLIGTLEDPVARARFIEQLRAVAQSADATATKPASVDELGLGLVELFTERVNKFGQGLVDLSAVIVDLPDLLDWLRFQAFDPAARAYWYEFLGIIALVIALSIIAYRLVRRWLAAPMHQLEHEQPETVAQRVAPLLMRAGLRLLPVAAFVGAGYSVLWVADGQFSTEIVATSLIHEFFQGFCNHALATLHIDNLRGENSHHIAETMFKAFGRALRMAVEPDLRMTGVPSTKGVL